jgi:membrane dipeptidase
MSKDYGPLNLSEPEVDAMRAHDVLAARVAFMARCVIGVILLSLIGLLFSLRKFVSSGGKRGALGVVMWSLLASSMTYVLVNEMPPRVEAALNGVESLGPLPQVGELSRQILKSAPFVADLHADSLLWGRDLLARADQGHVDVPRLIEGNVALQGFTIVSMVPGAMSFVENDRPTMLADPVLLLGPIGQQWGLDSLTSLAARVVAQSAALHRFAAASDGALRIVRTRRDLADYVEARRDADGAITAGYLGIEGLHALDGNLNNVDLFYRLGVRTLGLAHFFDNEVAGSAHGVDRYGLTAFGVQVVRRAERLNMFVDIAHASEAAIDDVCDMATRPLISSHTGVRGVCDNQRNLQDAHIDCVAATGGVLGVAYFRPSICGLDEIASIVQTMRYIADRVGVQHVALGSDYDGAVTVPFDTSRLDYIVQAMLDNGFDESDIHAILGGNVLRLFEQYLPIDG